jgi:hypothetical protein
MGAKGPAGASRVKSAKTSWWRPKLRWLGLAVLGAVVSAVVGPPAYWVYGKMTSIVNGAKGSITVTPQPVPRLNAVVSGTASHVPSGDVLWVIVIPSDAPEGSGFPQMSLHLTNGSFASSRGQLTVGAVGDAAGEWTIELVYANGEAVNQILGWEEFNYKLSNPPPMVLPSGLTKLSSITVERQGSPKGS